ncbi:hypothetical protein VI34_05595 [Methylophilales bacterium MBRSG12]|uniref:Uncharacterized protein n=1 Tax=Methylophilales bacterium MBRS-H7 TaxID=1623450 RepID=A0A0H4J286_9PROT|nr:hypothetical protein UZ34_04730 [Methylophilales bacterium MBRSF5]AKO66160.1 hypothetical protein VI33_05595 [Methylophilales bacterium MBRS-H7]AKO67479.1 hypothetical protein VI34_05595 [Methylophilales bacterium MBRSG12]
MLTAKKELLWKKINRLFKSNRFNDVISLTLENINDSLNYDNIKFINLAAEASLQTNQLELAKKFLEHSLKIDSQQYLPLYNLGVMHEIDEKFINAISYYKQSLNYNPEYFDARFNLANVLKKIQKFEDALIQTKQLIKLHKNYDSMNLHGAILLELNELDSAFKIFTELNSQYKDPNILNSIAKIYRKWGNQDKFFLTLEEAYEVDKNFPQTNHNLGNYYESKRKYMEAEKFYNSTLKFDDNPDTRISLGICQLKQQKFNIGWENYESRWKSSHLLTKFIKTRKPLWNGDQCDSILVWGEQGIGDEILYCSMLNDVSKFANKVFYSCSSKKITSILKRNFPNITILHTDDVTSDDFFDTHIPVGNLGRYLRNNPSSFKNTNYRIHPDPKNKTLIKTKFSDPMIGISWRSNDQLKNIELANFKSLINSRYKLISLQYQPTDDELKILIELGIIESKLNIYDDLESLLSLIDCCDYIVTSSNINAHFAGALNKKTFLLDKNNIELKHFHYWSSPTKNSLWYPSIEIVNQKKENNWKDEFQYIKSQIDV